MLPRQVFTDRGEWYVTADDERSGEVRTFRIDRIESIEPTGEHPPTVRDASCPVPGDWFTDGSIPGSRSGSAPAARWVIERYPMDTVGEPDGDGWVTATLPVVSEPWFTRTLVRLGPDAEVVEPEEWRDDGAGRDRAGARLATVRS